MNVDPIHARPSVSTPPSRRLEEQRLFSSVLSRSDGSTEGAGARSAAALVAVALVQPVLASMRRASFAAPPFAPNSAERQFLAAQDAATAQRLVSAAHWPLLDALTARFTRPGGVR